MKLLVLTPEPIDANALRTALGDDVAVVVLRSMPFDQPGPGEALAA